MINIRPVSDLRNKYTEIESLVLKQDEDVYLTKNGYGTMVVMSLKKYSDLIKNAELEKKLEEKFGNVDIEKLLDESEKELNNSNTKYLTHNEVFSKVRAKIDEKK